MYADIIWNVSQRVVVLVSETSCRTYLRMNVFCTIYDAFIENLQIVIVDSLVYRVGDYGSRVVSHHASSVSRAGPFREEVVFTCYVGKTLLDLSVH